MFETSLSTANVVVKNVDDKSALIDSGQSNALYFGQPQPQPPAVHNS